MKVRGKSSIKMTKRGTRFGGSLRLQYAITASGVGRSLPAITNAKGELTNSRRHEFKAYFTYLVPRIDVMLGGNYTGLSGRPYTPYGQFSSGQLNLPGTSRRQIFLQPRGSERNDFSHQVDLRAEKAFTVQTHRFGVYADLVNLFNSAAVTARQTRYPSTTISGQTVLYKAPTGIQGARQVTFGARWAF